MKPTYRKSWATSLLMWSDSILCACIVLLSEISRATLGKKCSLDSCHIFRCPLKGLPITELSVKVR